MVEEDFEPDFFTFPRVLKLYAGIGSVRLGEEVHCHLVRAGFVTDGFVLNAFADMYSKCGVQIHGWVIRRGLEWNLSIANSLMVMYSSHGRLEKACWIINLMRERDVVSWNSIISPRCKRKEALAFLEQTEEVGVEPDKITFVSILLARAHFVLLKE
ncbi:hypothetical protein LR48_Vigan11g172100 [Vigna angularis]|uniref:Pentatricopeptide repeat-containing protein n=1 Tax=Phaseolus angularis TaxID=3914 RepID=A0A0L9VV13_PHAAN|nr:hypothetical protein LR48_Vigan11g172100 [Vigna angularis]